MHAAKAKIVKTFEACLSFCQKQRGALACIMGYRQIDRDDKDGAFAIKANECYQSRDTISGMSSLSTHVHIAYAFLVYRLIFMYLQYKHSQLKEYF